MNAALARLLSTDAPPATLLIRLMVGGVFFFEGIQKFLYPAELAAGRFAKIGIPYPELMGPFVGAVETLGGALLLLGLLTRPAAAVLVINISVAIFTTKVPILLGHGFWGFSLRELKRYGFLSMMHEGRNDFCMLLGGLFLIVVGAGLWSLDARRSRRA